MRDNFSISTGLLHENINHRKSLSCSFPSFTDYDVFPGCDAPCSAESELSLWSATKRSPRGAVQGRDWPDSRARGPVEDAQLDVIKASAETLAS